MLAILWNIFSRLLVRGFSFHALVMENKPGYGRELNPGPWLIDTDLRDRLSIVAGKFLTKKNSNL